VAIHCPVIFTTAYDEYAIQAFRVNSIDYLLKPVKEADLRGALTKLRTMRQVLAGQPNSLQTSLESLLQQLRQNVAEDKSTGGRPDREHPLRDRFYVKQGQRLFSVPIGDIPYFLSRHKLTFLKTGDSPEWLIDYTMDELERMLDPQRFFRLNRQIIAEMRSVERVNLYLNGKLKVTLKLAFEQDVLVSKEKAPEFKC
jgi:DNA-binding LytR/AlgR family response regulator